MSRSTTTTGTAPQSAKAAQAAAMQPQAGAATQTSLPQDKIAMLAYQKWLKGGCKHGNVKKDWMDAEAELKLEMMKSGQPRR